jgi:hypothetical protein
MGRCGIGFISSFEWPTSALDLQDAAGLPQVAAMQERLGFQSALRARRGPQGRASSHSVHQGVLRHKSTRARSVLPTEPGMVHDKRQHP